MEEKNSKVVRNPEIARKLLPKHKIIDIKPSKDDTWTPTWYVFENTQEFQEDFDNIIRENRRASFERRVEREVEARLKKMQQCDAEEEHILEEY